MDNNVIRRRYLFQGRVQGVGFRYHAEYAAKQLGLTGWVENLDDGDVLMEVQGPAEQVDKLIPAMLRTAKWIVITDYKVKALPLKEREYGFHTRGW